MLGLKKKPNSVGLVSKKKMVITLKSKKMVKFLSPVLINQMYKQFKQPIAEGKIIMEDEYNEDESEAKINFILEGTKEELEEWTKFRIRDKTFLKAVGKLMEIEITDMKD